MARIRAEELANYVNNEKEHLEHILINQKKLPLFKNQSLRYYISNIETLGNSEEDYYYKRSSVSVAFEEEFDKDPLRAENGGPYQYCNYYLISNDFATSYIDYRALPSINVDNPYIIKTSDGQEIVLTSNTSTDSLIITWDTNKDNIIDTDGEILRWVKTYSNRGTGYLFPLHETSEYLSVLSPVKYLIFDGNNNDTAYNGYGYYTLRNAQKLCEVIYKNNVIEMRISASGTPYSGIYEGAQYLKYFKNTNDNAIITQNSLYKFYRIEELELNISRWTNTNLSESQSILSTGFSCLKRLIINTKTELFVGRLIQAGEGLKSINISNTINYTSNYILANSMPALESLDLTNIETTSTSALVIAAPNLKYLYVPNDWKYSISLARAYSLTKNSINNLLDKLHDYTGDTTHTISFSSYIKALIDPNKLEAAQNKNWTISFSAN